MILLAACAPSSTQRAAKAGFPARATPEHKRVRLGWVTWPNADTMIYCNRRVDDQGNLVGVLGPCWRYEAGEPAPKKIMSWSNLGRPDSTPPAVGPWDRCTLELEDARLVPTPSPARASLQSPTAKTPLDEWTPDPKLTGDAYATEVSFSPEGKWMAVLHLSIGLGEGERTIEIADAKLAAVPACR